MKKIKCFLTIFIVMFLFIISSVFHYILSNREFQITFSVENEEIKTWSENNENYYVFLPTYANLNNTKISEISDNIYIGGRKYCNGSNLSDIMVGNEYDFYVKSKHCTLTFLQSENIPAMYINTATGSIDEIEKDKTYKEHAALHLVNTNGALEYSTSYAIINTRGNATFLRDKKPYIVTLGNEKTNLLGMSKSNKYILLANSIDMTNMRNKLVYDFAEKNLSEWSPKSEYVDLYLNGVYNGLYLLVEKLEISEDKIKTDDLENTFLGMLELTGRYDTADDPFITENNQVIDIKLPKPLEKDTKEKIIQKVNSIENVVFSDEENSALFNELIDINSWAELYLIDEMFENIDAGLTSAYFYSDTKNKKIKRGPVWDYDGILGIVNRCSNYSSFIAKSKYNFCEWNNWYNMLLQRDEFRSYVKNLYYTKYQSEIISLLNNDIDRLHEQLKCSSYMNEIRWKNMYEKISDMTHVNTITDLKIFLKNRIDFLNDTMYEMENYHVIVTVIDNDGIFYAVKDNEKFTDIPNPNDYGMENFAYWTDYETGKIFDTSTPITKDMRLIANKIEVSDPNVSANQEHLISRIIHNKIYIFTLGFMAVFGMIFVIILYKEIHFNWRRKK